MEDVIVINKEKLKESIRSFIFDTPNNEEEQFNKALKALCDKVDSGFENLLALTIVSAMITASDWSELK